MGITNRAIRNVFRKKTRTLLVVLALGFSIAAIMSVNMGIEASRGNTQEMIDQTIVSTEAMMEDYEQYLYEMENLTDVQLRQIIVMNFSFGGGGGVPGSGGGRPPMGTISGDIVENISLLDDVEEVLPSITQRYGESMRSPDYIVYGVLLDPELNDKYQILPTNIIEGRQLAEGDLNAVIINTELKDFFGCEVGETIEIENMDFEVVGTYLSGVEQNGIYMGLSNAQEIMDFSWDESTSLNVYAQNASDVDAVIYDIEELYPTFRVTSYETFGSLFADRQRQSQEEQIDQMETDMENQVAQLEEDMSKIESTGSQIILISTITAGLMIMFLMLYAVKERTKEIGVLKALGFSCNNIMGQFVSEGTIIGFMGGLLGIILALTAAPILSDILLPSSEAFATSTPSIELILVAVLLTICLGAFGSLYPAWSASRKDPVEAMRNE
jgi:putative ABC transport system permease protein